MSKIAALMLTLLGAAAVTAQERSPVTFDFEELSHQDAQVRTHGRVYSGIGRDPSQPFSANTCVEDPNGCFMLIAQHYSPVANPPDFATLGTQWPGFSGSTALSHHISTGEIVLMRTDGGSFDVLQIDLAEHPSLDSSGNVILSGPFDITFHGIKRNGKTVSHTVTLTNSVFGLERFVLKGLSDLRTLSWFQGGGGTTSPAHQFDNLMVLPR